MAQGVGQEVDGAVLLTPLHLVRRMRAGGKQHLPDPSGEGPMHAAHTCTPERL